MAERSGGKTGGGRRLLHRADQCSILPAVAEAVDRRRRRSYSEVNQAYRADKVNDEALKQLEQRVDELVGFCRRLKKENGGLRSGHQDLTQEHARLVEKTQVARARIESMIGRLKTLERN